MVQRTFRCAGDVQIQAEELRPGGVVLDRQTYGPLGRGQPRARWWV